MLGEFALNISKAKVPVIGNAWENIVAKECQDALKKA